MSKLTRVLTVGAMLAAMHLAAMTTAADATLARVLARERFSIPNQTPAQVPAPAPPQPTGQSDWLLAALAALSAVLAVVAGLAMVAARRANRRARVGPAT